MHQACLRPGHLPPPAVARTVEAGMRATLVFLLMIVAVACPSVAVQAQADTPKVERPVWPPAGSTWNVKLTLSGSLGSGTRQSTFESLGEIEWNGRRVNSLRGVTQQYFDSERRIVGAAARDGTPIQTYHPYEALYDWLLSVGKSWPSALELKVYQGNQTLDLKFVFAVEAFEEITVPAGTFKTFRILRTGPNDRMVVWYEPKLGLEVKRDWERFATHPFGPGTHQMEMLSYALKN
jgi:hypothetical protein